VFNIITFDQDYESFQQEARTLSHKFGYSFQHTFDIKVCKTLVLTKMVLGYLWWPKLVCLGWVPIRQQETFRLHSVMQFWKEEKNKNILEKRCS
jgi:hypothetical protein